MFIINGITTDSKTFYIRLYHRKQIIQRGSQIGTSFRDGIQSTVSKTAIYHKTIPRAPRSLRSLFPRAIYSLRRYAPCFDICPSAYFTFLVVGAHPLLDYRFALSAVPAPPKIRNRSNAPIYFFHYHKKMCDSIKAINIHSRAPTEQYLYVWEPHRGCLHKVKKCAGTPSLKRANGAIKM